MFWDEDSGTPVFSVGEILVAIEAGYIVMAAGYRILPLNALDLVDEPELEKRVSRPGATS